MSDYRCDSWLREFRGPTFLNEHAGENGRRVVRRSCSGARVAVLIVVLLLVLDASPVSAAPPAVSREVKTAISARVGNGYNPGIALGVVNADGRAFFSAGVTSYDADVVPDEHTLYEIGSVTKVFTSLLLADAVQRGEAALDEPVEALFDGLLEVPERGGRAITLQHLSTHTSGLPYNPPFVDADPLNPFASFSDEDLVEFLATYQLPRNPGQLWEYSNLGVGLLGNALAARLGTTYEAALHERVIDPLDLSETVITPTPEQRDRFAQGYFGFVPRDRIELPSLEAAGILLSSVSDMLTFLENQMAIVDSPLADAVSATQEIRFNAPNVDMALGWFTVQIGANTIYMHDGATIGQTAFVGFNPATKTGVAVLTNARVHSRSGVTEIGLKVLVPQFPVPAVPRPYDITTDELRNHHGRFVDGDGNAFEFDIFRDHLTMMYSGNGDAAYTMYAESEHEFILLDAGGDATATFDVDGEGMPVSMSWTQLGNTATYEKAAIPPGLRIAKIDGGFELVLEGDTNTDYAIEQSPDFNEWTRAGVRTIWDEPLVTAREEGNPMLFYRATKIE